MNHDGGVKGGLESVLEAIAAKDADKVSIRLASSLDTLSQLELAQVDLFSCLPLISGQQT
jgi:hypothetical protein